MEKSLAESVYEKGMNSSEDLTNVVEATKEEEKTLQAQIASAV